MHLFEGTRYKRHFGSLDLDTRIVQATRCKLAPCSRTGASIARASVPPFLVPNGIIICIRASSITTLGLPKLTYILTGQNKDSKQPCNISAIMIIIPNCTMNSHTLSTELVLDASIFSIFDKRITVSSQRCDVQMK